MLTSLTHWLESNLADNSSNTRDRDISLQTATAALLMEVARADFDHSGQEMQAVERLLREQFELDEEHAHDLMRAATAESEESASLYRFTHAVHGHLTQQEKRRMIEMLWKVALADDVLDKYEDSLMHKVAGLIYVPNGQLMAMKHKVLEELKGNHPSSA